VDSSLPQTPSCLRVEVMEQFEAIGDGLLVRAPGKINLSLLVAGKRPDGYHEIETVMSKINLFDEIFIERGEEVGIELLCRGPYPVPAGPNNTVYRACRLVFDYMGDTSKVRITLTKNIPAGSGLGSGSSDAAATLTGLKRFLQLPLTGEQLLDLAGKIGSDVAFFLDGPLALCTGRGEKIKKIRANFDFTALLVLPDVSVSTKEVYDNYRHDAALYDKLKGQIKRYIEKNRIDLISRMCANMLEQSCFELYKELGELKAQVESIGAGRFCLSGSGSALYCILQDEERESAELIRDEIEHKVDCKTVIVSNNRW